MTVIPRADLNAIGARRRWNWTVTADKSPAEVRAIASFNRSRAAQSTGGYRDDLLAEADDLDALVDRIEREAGAS